jgi:hypothetical protein
MSTMAMMMERKIVIGDQRVILWTSTLGWGFPRDQQLDKLSASHVVKPTLNRVGTNRSSFCGANLFLFPPSFQEHY